MKAVKKDTREREYDALKPVFGSRGGQPPFYDPNDLHACVWKKGKLGAEDDPKSPIYSKAKLNIRDCVYCKICHKIQDNFQSTVGDNKDIVKGVLETVLEDEELPSYQVNLPIERSENYGTMVEIPLDTPQSSPKSKNPINNERLFLPPEGVLDGEYVKVKKDTTQT